MKAEASCLVLQVLMYLLMTWMTLKLFQTTHFQMAKVDQEAGKGETSFYLFFARDPIIVSKMVLVFCLFSGMVS